MIESHFKQTDLGELPEEWEIVRIANLAETKSGGTPSTAVKAYWQNGTIPWINSGELKDTLVKRPTTYITNEASENSAAKVFPKGSVLIALTGATTGKVGILTFNSSVNQSITAIFPSTKHVPEYLFYYLMKDRQRILSHNIGAAQPHINKGIVDNLQVALPPLPEQKKIAAVLTTVDAAIEKTNEIIEKSKQLKKGLMQELLTRGIGHKTFKQTEIGEIPEEWETAPLSELVSKMASGGTPLISIKDYYHGNIPFAKIEDLTRTQKYVSQTETAISEKGLENSAAWIVPANSVLYSIYATLGEARIAAVPMATNQAILAIIPKEEKLNHVFLFYYLSSLKGKLTKYHKETTQKNLTKHAVKSFQIPLPPLPEQKKIAAVLTTVDAKIDAEVQRRSQLETLKKGLMQDLLTGRVRFPEFVKGANA